MDPSPEGWGPCDRCGEAEKSCSHRMLPNPKQIPFLQSAAFEALYGGGKGSGKTRALILAPLYWVHVPAFRGLLLRREWKQAARTLLEESKKVYPAFGAVWLAGVHAWKFPCPDCAKRRLSAAVCRHPSAQIEINGCDHDSDTERYFGTPELSYLGIDQLEHFTREMHLSLISCLRSAAGLPLVVRATANPGGIGLDWLTERFGPWLQRPPGDAWHDASYTGPYAESGAVLWFRTTAGENGTEIVCDSRAHEPECVSERRRISHATQDPPCAPGAPCSLHTPRSRQYVHAVVSDNPFTAGTDYERNLLSLDPVERAWYLGGNWMMRGKPGAYFSRTWLTPALREAPAKVLVRVRYWDRASTKDDPRAAFTAGVRMSLLDSGLFLVEHVERGQWDPGEVDARILSIGDTDPRGTVLAIERDGGQAGRSQAYYDARMLAGREFVLRDPVLDKVTRMRPFSAQSRAGNVAILEGAWNGEYLRELEGCPSGKWDQIDSSSGALFLLLELQEKMRVTARAMAHRAQVHASVAASRRDPLVGGGASSWRGW